MKALYLFPLALLAAVSCGTSKNVPQQTAAPSASGASDLVLNSVITAPLAADITVADKKIKYKETAAFVNVDISGDITGNLPAYKQIAYAKALASNDADILVAPSFIVETTSGRLEVTVYGYPARYTNFRRASSDDINMSKQTNASVATDFASKDAVILGAAALAVAPKPQKAAKVKEKPAKSGSVQPVQSEAPKSSAPKYSKTTASSSQPASASATQRTYRNVEEFTAIRPVKAISISFNDSTIQAIRSVLSGKTQPSQKLTKEVRKYLNTIEKELKDARSIDELEIVMQKLSLLYHYETLPGIIDYPLRDGIQRNIRSVGSKYKKLTK